MVRVCVLLCLCVFGFNVFVYFVCDLKCDGVWFVCCAFVGVCDCVLLVLINECVLCVKCCVMYYVVCVLCVLTCACVFRCDIWFDVVWLLFVCV